MKIGMSFIVVGTFLQMVLPFFNYFSQIYFLSLPLNIFLVYLGSLLIGLGMIVCYFGGFLAEAKRLEE